MKNKQKHVLVWNRKSSLVQFKTWQKMQFFTCFQAEWNAFSSNIFNNLHVP